jgi:hypothetical protein
MTVQAKKTNQIYFSGSRLHLGLRSKIPVGVDLRLESSG